MQHTAEAFSKIDALLPDMQPIARMSSVRKTGDMSPIEPPSDFDAFWRTRFGAARSIKPAPLRWPTADSHVTRIEFSTWGGHRIGGWLVLPDGPIRSAVIMSHGYGGRDAPDQRWVPDDAVALYVVARGLPALSLLPGFPSVADEHVLYGIQSRENYIHGGCAADVWCAVSALESLLGTSVGKRYGGMPTGYFGSSFGGGIGAMAVPWDDRIDSASLHVPSFGAHRLRLQETCSGSGAAVSTWVAEHHEAWQVLSYFDAATAAARLRVPTIVAPAADDPAVPPVGQWAVAHAIPEKFRTVMPMTAGHRPYPQEEREMSEYVGATRRLFSAPPPAQEERLRE